jgi:antitoxin ParD1/3/4
MTITLPREQQEWLASIVAERMHLDIDDLAWAKPLIDEALASVDRGEGMTLEEYRARMEQRFGRLERSGA